MFEFHPVSNCIQNNDGDDGSNSMHAEFSVEALSISFLSLSDRTANPTRQEIDQAQDWLNVFTEA